MSSYFIILISGLCEYILFLFHLLILSYAVLYPHILDYFCISEVVFEKSVCRNNLGLKNYLYLMRIFWYFCQAMAIWIILIQFLGYLDASKLCWTPMTADLILVYLHSRLPVFEVQTKVCGIYLSLTHTSSGIQLLSS